MSPTVDSGRWLTSTEAARYLGRTSRSWFLRFIAKHPLGYVGRGRGRRWDRLDLDRLMATLKVHVPTVDGSAR